MSTLVGTAALVVLLATAAAAWRRLLRRAGESHDVVTAAGALVSMALADLTGALTGDLRTGFLVIVVVVVALSRLATRRESDAGTRGPPSWEPVESIVAAGLVALLAWCAFGSWMWDEQSAHLPLAGAAARGVLPLEHPAFPGQPLRYHAGYAVAVGVVRAFTALPLDVCADLVTLGGVVALVVGIREVLRRLGLSGPHAAVGLLVVLCTGGPLAALLADGWGAPLPGKALLPASWVNGATFPPLVVTNVLQHPQGLAMPVALAVILLLASHPGSRLARVAVAAALVVALARIQILFSAFCGLLLLLVAVRDLAWRRPGAAGALGVVAAAGALALVAGGIGVGAVGDLVWGAGYFAGDGAAALVHEALAFGVSAATLPAALWLAPRAADAETRTLLVACGLLGAFGLVIGNVAVYARSWDIVKFFGVGFFFGHLALAAALARLPRRWLVAVVVLSCWSGLFWLLRHGPLQGIVAPAARERPLDAVAVAVDDACGHAVPGRARVFSTARALWQVGWLVPGTPWQVNRDTAGLLLDRARVDDDVAAWTRARRQLDAGALEAFRADVVVVDEAMIAAPRQGALADAGFVRVCGAAGMAVWRRRAGGRDG